MTITYLIHEKTEFGASYWKNMFNAALTRDQTEKLRATAFDPVLPLRVEQASGLVIRRDIPVGGKRSGDGSRGSLNTSWKARYNTIEENVKLNNPTLVPVCKPMKKDVAYSRIPIIPLQQLTTVFKVIQSRQTLRGWNIRFFIKLLDSFKKTRKNEGNRIKRNSALGSWSLAPSAPRWGEFDECPSTLSPFPTHQTENAKSWIRVFESSLI